MNGRKRKRKRKRKGRGKRKRKRRGRGKRKRKRKRRGRGKRKRNLRLRSLPTKASSTILSGQRTTDKYTQSMRTKTSGISRGRIGFSCHTKST